MTTNYRDARTGQWTTAADAAERPAETVTETVPTRHETPDVAELRRKAGACPMSWNGPGTLNEWYQLEDLTERYHPIPPIDAAFIAAANPAAVLGLLDRLAHMTEARDNARAEVERLTALLAEVRAWATACATQATDYDEDTEQQIEDGREVLRILDATPGEAGRERQDQDAADDSGCDCPEDPESVYLAHTPECRPRSPRDAQPNRRTERSMTALPSGDHIASEGHDCTLTIGSLFSGYGGLERAVEEVFDARTAWVSDIDRGACKVLAHRYPHAPNLGDITRVDWAAVEPVDIITGGSPCQDLSHAGRRAGMTEGTRSNLWASMREAIATIRPRLVVWENVQGALSVEAASDLEHCPGCMGDPRHGRPVLRALGRVLGDLADLGFDAEVVGLRAADVGACHGRFRVFVLAYAHGARLQGQPHPQGAPSPQRHRHPVAGAGGPDLTLLPTPRATDGSKGGPNQRGSSGDLMLPSAVARLLPTPRTSDTNGAAQHGTGGADLRTAVQLLPTPSVADTQGGRKHRSGERNDELLLNGIAHADRWGDYAAAIARHEHAWGVPAPEPTEPGAKGNPRLSAAFCEWMMMQPAGWITDTPGITRNEALKLCGNGVVTPQAAHALRVMLNRIDGRSAA